MIDCKTFYNYLKDKGITFFTGVPDSLLKDFCAYISDNTDSSEHVITANEGGAISLAAGYHIATKKIPFVYMQNSGLGNSINPLLSLADSKVYSIPMLLMIGWRGEPGVKDEPQHIKQGAVQNKMLKAMGIHYYILDNTTSNIKAFLDKVIKIAIENQEPVAIVVRKGTFNLYKQTKPFISNYKMTRERALEIVLETLPLNTINVSTTGKLSREVFEYRFRNQQGHQNDFLTVGSMGHCSQIALGIALYSKKKIVCLDGDGAALMHMGAMAIIGKLKPSNFYHVIFNNGSHESVGGQESAGFNVSFNEIALGCGYHNTFSASTEEELKNILQGLIDLTGPVLLEIKIKSGSRSDLGRPSVKPVENKKLLIEQIHTNE